MPLLLFLLLVSPAARADSLRLGVGFSRRVSVPNVVRAAMGNAKVARVRTVDKDTLLVTGVKAGQTLLRAWDGAGRDREFPITVTAAELDALARSDPSAGRAVVKVAIEFWELERAVGSEIGARWPDTLQFDAAARMAGAASVSGLNYTIGIQSARGFLQLLARNGWAKVLANPELYVRLGEEAVFQSGGELPVPSTSESYGRAQRHIEWKPFGLMVRVRPASGDGLHIRSDIHVEISEPDPSRGVDGVPALNRRNLDTKMDSEDGETVLLSGLLRQTSSDRVDSVPLLGAIPFLGALFSHRARGTDESEILLSVTFNLSTRAKERERRMGFRSRFEEVGR